MILVIRNHKSLIQAHFTRDHELESFLEDRELKAAAELVRRLTELVDLQYVEQERPLGLAHAIGRARSLVGAEPFVVLLPDVIMLNDEPVTGQLIRAHEQHGGSVVAIREVAPRDLERHGIVQVERPTAHRFDRYVCVTGLFEKPSIKNAPSRLGVFGRYLLEPAIWDAIAQTDPDLRGEVQLTDALNLLCREKPLYGLFFDGQHYDAGDRAGYLWANIELTLQDLSVQQPLRGYLARALS